MSAVAVRAAELDDYVWRFRDGACEFSYGHRLRRSVTVDPFPAYAHDPMVVQETFDLVAAAWPPETDLTVWVLDREDIARTNGYADATDHQWSEETETYTVWDGHIVLSGKRIPPHPAVTRYVVAHEYGHHVGWWLERRYGLPHNEDRLVDAYAELRGYAVVKASGGRWHEAVSELFADDFRLLISGVEVRYWPHPRLPKPFQLPEVLAWWQAIRRGELPPLPGVEVPADRSAWAGAVPA